MGAREMTDMTVSGRRADPAERRVRRGISPRGLWRYRYLYLLALPGIVYYLVFWYLPMVGIVIAFKNYTITQGVFGSPWVGVQNFTDFFQSAYFWTLLRNTIVINALKLVVGFPATIGFALLLNEIDNRYFKRVIQTISYFPYFLRRRRPPPTEWSGFLSPESLPYRICLGIYVFASLNLLIIACSLFVVTLPPGLAALFCVVRKLVRDEEPPVWRAFARYFVQNLKQSLLVGAFLVMLYFFLFEDVRVLIATGAARSPALLAATVIACGLSILVSLYIFPLMAHGYFSLRQLVIGSVVVALYRPHLTAANLLILAGGLLVARRYPFLLLSCYFSLAAYMTYWFAERTFRGLFPSPDREVEE